MTQSRSPLSGRPAKYFRAVNYQTGLASNVCNSADDAVASFKSKFSETPPSMVCATSKSAVWWWDAEGQPDRLFKRNGRIDGEVWTIHIAEVRT